MSRFFQRTIFLSLGLFLLAACDYMPFGYTPIGEIHQHPGRYEGKEIKVKGEVTAISKLPFVEIKTYTLRDDTGEITVFTHDVLPVLNDRMAIKARVRTAAILNDQSFGLRLEEIRKLPTF